MVKMGRPVMKSFETLVRDFFQAYPIHSPKDEADDQNLKLKPSHNARNQLERGLGYAMRDFTARQALNEGCSIILECNSCREVFRSVKRFLNHYKKCQAKLLAKLSTCEIACSSEESYATTDNNRRHTYAGIPKVNGPPKEFISTNMFSNDPDNEKKINNSINEPIKAVKSKLKSQYNRKIMKKDPRRIYPCISCNKLFTSRINIMRHFKMSHREIALPNNFWEQSMAKMSKQLDPNKIKNAITADENDSATSENPEHPLKVVEEKMLSQSEENDNNSKNSDEES